MKIVCRLIKQAFLLAEPTTTTKYVMYFTDPVSKTRFQEMHISSAFALDRDAPVEPSRSLEVMQGLTEFFELNLLLSLERESSHTLWL